MAEVPFRPVRQLSEYNGKGASASREPHIKYVDMNGKAVFLNYSGAVIFSGSWASKEVRKMSRLRRFTNGFRRFLGPTPPKDDCTGIIQNGETR